MEPDEVARRVELENLGAKLNIDSYENHRYDNMIS